MKEDKGGGGSFFIFYKGGLRARGLGIPYGIMKELPAQATPLEIGEHLIAVFKPKIFNIFDVWSLKILCIYIIHNFPADCL
jgi:hypothetical protein